MGPIGRSAFHVKPTFVKKKKKKKKEEKKRKKKDCASLFAYILWTIKVQKSRLQNHSPSPKKKSVKLILFDWKTVAHRSHNVKIMATPENAPMAYLCSHKDQQLENNLHLHLNCGSPIFSTIYLSKSHFTFASISLLG